ncbi:MAG: glycerol-3-phosphate dehydrogenase/oxidase [Deltaproteobacteria bacterium]|nr:glycerol-3-phosphate dehydrogenase/oxidase [Deltaproteobacteria bacterium]
MEFDLIVIGGGVNGCGIARDAAMRGVKTLLIERDDFACAASGNNSQMIHGGARYLTSDLKTTQLSSIDSGYIQKIAPHLIFRIPFIFPILKPDHKRSKWRLALLDAYFRAYDRFGRWKNAKPHLRLSREEALKLEPDLSPDITGAVTFDEFGIDSPRLSLLNALSAHEHGATLKNHTQVLGLILESGAVVGVKVKDLLKGTCEEYRSKIIFNATGPWASKLARLAGVEIKVRPTKGVHITFEGRFLNTAIMTQAIDGRTIFIMPHQNTTILGTTDDDYFGDPGDIPILEDEVEYLLEGVERVFPRIRQARMLRAWAGVRPTLYRRGLYEDDLSREHWIIDHETQDAVAGLVSVIGGKLASYRILAEEATDLICQKLSLQAVCHTHEEPLPGGDAALNIEALAKLHDLDALTVERLTFRHGTLAKKVLSLLGVQPSNANRICQCEPVMAAEIRYAVRSEFCRSLEDLRRRTRFSIGVCGGNDCVFLAAVILGEELGWEPLRVFKEVNLFLQNKWKETVPVLQGEQLAQSELASFMYYGMGCIDQI